jgi:uncharacterized membrane protein HdeD (DUF308 family)
MEDVLERSWWWLLLMGLVAVAFGVVVFLWPGISLWSFVVLFGLFAIAWGFFAVFASIETRKQYERWWGLLLGGLVSIIVGVIALVWPGITALVVLYLIAAWFVATGIMQVSGAIALRKKIMREKIRRGWLIVLGGTVSVILGILLFIWPAAGALAILWLIATFAIIIGVLVIIRAFQVRRERKAIGQRAT